MTRIVVIAVAALVAAGCAVSEERSGPGADGVPLVSLACAEDEPACEDNVPTGGDTPLAPAGDDDVVPLSGGFVVGDGLTVPEALAHEGSEPVAVSGFVVRTPEGAWLCAALAESYPPQCGGERLEIAESVPVDALPMQEEADVQWTNDRVVLFGSIIDGAVFTLDDTVTG